MTSKQRAYLKSMAMDLDPIFNVGKASVPRTLSKESGKHWKSGN